MSSSSKKTDFSPEFERLRQEILASGISERDKQEMAARAAQGISFAAGSGGGFAGGAGDFSLLEAIRKDFEKARLGTDPVFKSRQATQMLFNKTVDQPDAARIRGGMLNFGSSVRK